LKWYPAWQKDKAPIDVTVDHNEDAIVEWVKNHLSKKINEDL